MFSVDRAIEGALFTERADMELIDDRAGKRPPSPQTIMPVERVVIDDMRPAIDAIGLPLGTGCPLDPLQRDVDGRNCR